MSPLFEFIIDKEANFVYWAQLLLGKWGWYFEKENHQLFSSEASPLSSKERGALERLKIILKNRENQYRWLWRQYNGDPIEPLKEQKNYSFIKTALDQRFKTLWDKEFPLLEKWKEELEFYDFQGLNPALQRIALFLGSDIETTFPTRVKLLISGNFPTGATRSDFGDLMILNVSRVPILKKQRVIGVIVHEFLHIMNNRRKLIAEFANNNSLPTIKSAMGYGWKYLITETILKSIASQRSNTYLGNLLGFSEEEKNKDADLSHKIPLKNYSYEFLIRIAASRILPETSRYLNAGKTIDAQFVKRVIEVLNGLLRERD